MTGSVEVERHGGWATVTFANPRQRNALTPAMLADVRDRVDDLAATAGLRAVILRGAGGTFSSGFAIDRIPAPEDLPEDDGIEMLGQAIEAAPVVVVAVIEGDCVGAALDIVCACDLRFALASARLGITPARLGLVYSWRGSARIQRAAGRDAARRLFYSGDLVRADSPVGRRLVTEVAPDGAALDAAARGFVSTVAANAPRAVAGAKRIFHALDAATTLDPDVAAEIHRSRQAALASADCAEARAAFGERRPPRFTGR
ncbi:MAG TPA: enoyl-CoA hydratase-related protein [Acidimicrobiales bacterium]